MPTAEERIDRLENIMIELADAQMRTQASLKRFSDETQAFLKRFSGETQASLNKLSDEMREFKEEARADRKQMNKQWGDLAHKMGTIVEDIVAPNIPRIAREYFGFRDIEDFMVRRQVRNKKDRAKRREFDVIAVEGNQVIINETKSTPRIDYIDAFIEVLPQIEDYFPEYAGKKIIPIFSSLYIGEDMANYLTRNQIYAMGMGEETMELINFRQVSDR